MGRPPSKHPTELELEILKILWRDGPRSARHVVDALAPHRGLAYTSVVTVMNIMTRKKYLKRLKEGTAAGYVYKPVASEQRTVGSMLRDLVDRAFRGSHAAAALNLLETSDLSPDELARIKAILESKSNERRPSAE